MVFNPDEITKMIFEAKDVKTQLVNSDADYGYLFTFSLPGDYQPANSTPMAPVFTDSGIDILLSMAETESEPAPASVKSKKRKPEPVIDDEPLDKTSSAIFSSAKYKVQISKITLPKASRAYLYSAGEEETSIDLINLEDNYLVNFPILLVMDPENETHLFFEY